MSENPRNGPTHLFECPRFVLLDLEFTAWPDSAAENWSAVGEHREVIAVGAIKVDACAKQVEAEYSRLIRPSINTMLSPHIQNLTGISQGQIDSDGCGLLEMLSELHGFCAGMPLYCYGWDALVIAENLVLNNIQHSVEVTTTGKILNLDPQLTDSIPIYGEAARACKRNLHGSLNLCLQGSSHRMCFEIHNFKPWLMAQWPESKGLSSGQLGSMFEGFEAPGQLHDPLFDVKSEFHALCHIFEKYNN